MIIEFMVPALEAAVRAGTPLLLATLGEIYVERSGVLNLGVEGMMIMGALAGFGGTLITGSPWLGLLAAAVVGGLMSLIHAFLSVTLRANQVVSGLSLTMFGLGLSGLLGRGYVGMTILHLTVVPIPILSKIPILGSVFFDHDPLVYISVALAVLLWTILFKTKVGISIRSVGENPATADALGVNVFLVRYLCVCLGGVLAGLGGAYLSVSYAPAWLERMTAGIGWIAVALTIFAMWNPSRAVVGAYLFGGVQAFQYRLQPYGVPASLLGMLPYVFTIIVLVAGTREVIRKKIGAPSVLGAPYVREEK